MFATDDTIVAVATPMGMGGIGVVRVSGPKATSIAEAILRPRAPLQPRFVTLKSVLNPHDGSTLDQVLVTFFLGPASYTGEDVLEISGHGNPVLLREIVKAALMTGARLAEPGEFTFRAYLSGRLDLVQAEAVGDLVEAVTPLQARVAFDQLEGTLTEVVSQIDRTLFDLIARLEASLDFPDEGYHFVAPGTVSGEIHSLLDRITRLLGEAGQGRLIREGCQVVILGSPNVGKSTLFNQLLGVSRAIVTDVAGTTRDLLTETAEIAGIPTTLVDTAGLRKTTDAIEAEGVARARKALKVSALTVVVLDRSVPLREDDRSLLSETTDTQRLVVINKVDLPACWLPSDVPELEKAAVLNVSLVGQDGAREVRTELGKLLSRDKTLRDAPTISNIRHIKLLELATKALTEATAAADLGADEEFVLSDLQEARLALEEISGKRTPSAVMEKIFSQYCIGK